MVLVQGISIVLACSTCDDYFYCLICMSGITIESLTWCLQFCVSNIEEDVEGESSAGTNIEEESD